MRQEKTIFNAIKIAVILSVCLLLSACAGFDTAAAARVDQQWKGHPLTDALGKWGRPIQTLPDTNGTNSFVWWFGKDYTYQQLVGSETKYAGDIAEYHSDGRVTYAPDYKTTNYYETKRGSRICAVTAHVDYNHMITYVEIKDYDDGCGLFFSSANAGPPDAESMAKGKAYAERFQELKSIIARHKALCTKADYAALFENSPCDDLNIKIVGARNPTKMTPQQKELVAKWNAEMNGILDQYRAFFLSSGEPALKSVVDGLDRQRAMTQDKKFDNGSLVRERMTLIATKQIQKFSEDVYGKYIN